MSEENAPYKTNKPYIEKRCRSMTLWIEHSGLTTGCIYVGPQSTIYQDGPEDPLEVFSRANPFLPFKKDNGHITFVNIRTIVRVAYPQTEDDRRKNDDMVEHKASIAITEKHVFTGIVREPMPQDFARLSDYLNNDDVKFIKLHTEDQILLLNKIFITHVDER